MRHWRHALEQIYEHRAAKTTSGYEPQTDTEKALVEALKQLELQCKERIDLLEALRISRQEGPSLSSTSSDQCTATTSSADRFDNRGKGSIGQGTIPAVTYSELSRPALPKRPSLPIRTLSNQATTSSPSGGAIGYHNNSQPSTGAKILPQSPILPPRPDQKLRSASPEKHTMRTTLRSGRSTDRPSKSSRRSPRPAADGSSKAATLAWSSLGRRERPVPFSDGSPSSSHVASRQSLDQTRLASSPMQWDSHSRRLISPRDADTYANDSHSNNQSKQLDDYLQSKTSSLSVSAASSALNSLSAQEASSADQPSSIYDRVPLDRVASKVSSTSKTTRDAEVNHLSPADDSGSVLERSPSDDQTKRAINQGCQRKPKALDSSPVNRPRQRDYQGQRSRKNDSSETDEASVVATPRSRRVNRKEQAVKPHVQSHSSDDTEDIGSSTDASWKKKKAAILKNLPPGVDEGAATQILNDVVVKGDEVHWEDIAGLEIAKNALRETVVYPFLRPDLFMGLREPARGMLLFGPPGTGKTMLARAVATESKSTFFSISASSLTSKFLGESEKLVRALFGLARILAPSIIFVDEIDSLLSQRSGSGEHEATRRIKTEFLIQWSDLQRAAAGREATERDKERGDANRVLVLAATNLPWAIDEAARRRFVRRQYIPLPELHTRETQLRALLGHQKHGLSPADVEKLVDLTAGESMGPVLLTNLFFNGCNTRLTYYVVIFI